MTLLLPDGARLLHIGPAKTGTTSLQSAFHVNRAAIAEHGVHYAGAGSQPRSAAAAVALGGRIAGHRTGIEAWPKLVAEVRGSTARLVVISSETFARAGDAGARAAVEGFGADRTHVVITMRPVVDMLASSWQQAVQTGSTQSYEDWLRTTLDWEPSGGAAPPAFWVKTRFDVLAERWGALVGPEHVTMVSLGGQPRGFVLRTFEALTGLPDGLLVPAPNADNASLGSGTTETLRRFNGLLRELPGADADLQARLVEFGAVRRMRTTPGALSTDVRIEVPRWAAERAIAAAREMNESIRRAGVRVVGDLDALTVPGRPPVETLDAAGSVSADAAAHLLVAMMLAAGNGLPSPPRTRVARAMDGLPSIRSRVLVRTLAQRALARARARLRRG